MTALMLVGHVFQYSTFATTEKRERYLQMHNKIDALPSLSVDAPDSQHGSFMSEPPTTKLIKQIHPTQHPKLHLVWFSRLSTGHGTKSLYCTICVAINVIKKELFDSSTVHQSNSNCDYVT